MARSKRRAGFAFADALDLGGVEGIQLPATLALLLRADLIGAAQTPLRHREVIGHMKANGLPWPLLPQKDERATQPTPFSTPLATTFVWSSPG
jgi:hypothetical protein